MRSIVWPGDLPVTQPYGCTTLTVEPAFADCPSGHKHPGLDVGMAVGTPLYAPEDSTVAYIGTALLALVGTRCWWFVHIDRVGAGVSVGKRLARGGLACYSGNKVPAGGASTGPHLHLEVQDALKAVLGYYDANGRFIVPAGALNNPRTSMDPVQALAGRFSSAGGALDDMNDVQDQKLTDLDNVYVKRNNPVPAGETQGETMLDRFGRWDVLLKAIAKAIPADLAARIDALRAVEDGVAGALSDARAAIANIKVTGGGLTPEQDAHLASIEAAVSQLEQQLAAGLSITGIAKAV